MATTLNEFANGLATTPRSQGVIDKNSRKLFGYDFVNYRSDCETSNANGLLKYNDVVNFGRRISDAHLHNCVMCGEFDVVIPTQNKDVCKACDSSFWYNTKLDVTFKFCKGCKNFVTLEMFSDKPDASKCCRCRRRGRENYLTKKFIGSQDMCCTPGRSAEPPPDVSPMLSMDTAEEALVAFKYGVHTPSSSAPVTALSLRAYQPIPYGTDRADACGLSSVPSSASSASQVSVVPESAPRHAVRMPYKKRSISADHASPTEGGGFYGSVSGKPPKNPRSVSYSNDLLRVAVTPNWGDKTSQAFLNNSHNTPSRKIVNTVTPGTGMTVQGGEGSGISGGSGRSVRFARSDSMCSTDSPSAEPGAPSSSHPPSQSQYLWDRSSYAHGSPQANSTITPLHYYVPSSSRAPSAAPSLSLSALDPRQLELRPDPSIRFSYPFSADQNAEFDKENDQSGGGEGSEGFAAISMLRNSCARLFSESSVQADSAPYAASEEPSRPETAPVVVSPILSALPLYSGSSGSSQDSAESEYSYQKYLPLGSHCKDLRRIASKEAASPPNKLISPPSQLSLVDAAAGGVYLPAGVSAAYLGEDSARSDSDVSSEGKESPEGRRHWEWDPCLNPLMHLAMITDRI